MDIFPIRLDLTLFVHSPLKLFVLAKPDYTPYDDAALLALLTQGNEAAFTALYDRYRDKL